MTTKKYLIANVKIPMEISENGTYESLTDYLSIDFTHCDKLPEKSQDLNSSLNSKYKSMIDGLFSNKTEDEEGPLECPLEEEENKEDDPFAPLDDQTEEQKEEYEEDPTQEEPIFKLSVLLNEIAQKKQGKNTSFKNKTKNKHTFSQKNKQYD